MVHSKTQCCGGVERSTESLMLTSEELLCISQDQEHRKDWSTGYLSGTSE